MYNTYAATAAVVTIWVVCFALAVWRDGFPAWFLVYTLGSFMVLQLLLRWVQNKNITVARSVEGTAYSGEDLKVSVHIKIHGARPVFWLYIRDEWHERLLFPFFQKHHRYVYVIENARRGSYESSGVIAEIGDCFGWLHKHMSYPSMLSFTVYPKSEAPIQTGTVRNNSDLQSGGFVREYVDGDAPSRIHWKTTARRDKLMSREQESTETKWAVWLDTNETLWNRSHSDLGLFEYAVQVSAGWLQYLHQKKATVSLYCGNKAMMKAGTSAQEIQTGLTMLASVMPEAAESPYMNNKSLFLNELRGHSHLIITSGLSRQAVNSILGTRNMGRELVLVQLEHKQELDKDSQARERIRMYHRLLKESGCKVIYIEKDIAAAAMNAADGGVDSA